MIAINITIVFTIICVDFILRTLFSKFQISLSKRIENFIVFFILFCRDGFTLSSLL
nr:hypothetical protein [Dinophyceae sp. MRD-151]